MKYSTIFVDIDDTIWDTRRNSRETFAEMYDNHGWGNYFESFDHFYDIYLPSNIHLWSLYAHGKIHKEELIVQRFLNPLGPYLQIDEKFALQLNEELLERVSQKTMLVDNARGLLDYLSAKYQLLVLSNGFNEVQHRKLQNANIDTYFTHVILSDVVGVNKPHPAIFRFALDAANVRKEEAVMLGDSWESDICGAYQSGIDQIWFNPDRLRAEGFEPTYIVTELKEIEHIL